LQEENLHGDELETSRDFAPRFRWGDFETLSYTWGEENSDGRVMVDGKLCQIPKNLEAALRTLRALPETEYGMKYWIDALCINQDDPQERNSEVKRMRSLYEKAWSNVVWLGEESDDSNNACDCISNIAHLKNAVRMQNPWVESIYGELDWKPLMNILSRQYWSRLWIIQELAMNHYNTLFICGSAAFFRQELIETLRFCKRENLMIQRFLNANPEHSGNKKQANPFESFRRVLNLVELDGQRGKEAPFENVLSLAQEASSTEMRDKIYGIHGLLPLALSARIQPDYDSSLNDVFQDFSEKLLQECGLEDLLSWSSAGSDMDLPSWCVNLSTKFVRNHMQHLRRRNANLNKHFNHHLIHNSKSLVCEGVILDTLESVNDFHLRSSDLNERFKARENIGDLEDEFRVVEDHRLINSLIETLLLGHPGRSGPYPSFFALPWTETSGYTGFSGYRELDIGRLNWRLFWEDVKFEGYLGAFDKFRKANATFRVCGHGLKTFFPACKPGVEPCPQEAAEERYVFELKHLTRWSQDGTNIVKDIRLAAISLVDRSLANTAKGHLALVPATAKKSDVIAIVACSFPIVLRRKERGYEYIGECYLHGFMDGEAFAGDEEREVKEFSIQ
jgi:hypothetical protein